MREALRSAGWLLDLMIKVIVTYHGKMTNRPVVRLESGTPC
jgi:hypothetical protein